MQQSSTGDLQPVRDGGWRERWFEIIYHHDTLAARRFDLLLVVAILASIAVIVLDSMPDVHARHGRLLFALEWMFTLLFTAEYAMRLLVVRRPLRYARSGWGIIDLLAILPTYASLFLPGTQSLLVVRALRVLRVFRILKLTQYVAESGVLATALWRSRRKILVFLSVVVTLVVIFGALMYVVEGPQRGFTSIPTGMYWAIVTMATVGFGDITPETPLGRLITSVLILIGYGIIAVPTGIYTAELATTMRLAERDASPASASASASAIACPTCAAGGHAGDAVHCRLCGSRLDGA